MGEPKYDEDTVNLGYLKKVISETSDEIEVRYKEVSRHYGAKPIPPYYKGDTWIDGDIVYTCINSRQIGLYEDSDWTTESGAKKEAEEKSKVFLTKPYNYRPGDMWILQSDDDHKAGKKGEMLISNAGRKDYNEDDWINMLGYGNIISINEVAENLNQAITRIGNVEDAIEDGVIITFYQSSIPEAKHLGDLWYVTDSIDDYIKGKLYRYDGTNWNLLEDPDIQKAFEEANEARIVADGKIQSFYSNTAPTSDVGVGDLWIDTANDNKLYRYNGTKWVAVYDTRIDNLIVTTNTTSERIAEIQTDLGNITSKVSTIEEQVTTTTGDIERIDKTITENTSKQEIKDNQILQTVTNQVTTAKQEAIDSANSSTDEKLQNYSTTSQMESKISQKADEFDVRLEGKVDNDTLTGAELALRINNGGSNAKLNSDRITLSANDILNLLAGNTINLTSKNIEINSSNFSVDKNGNITATGGEIGGFTLGEEKFSTNINGIYKYNLYDARNIIAMYYGKISKTDDSYSIYDINGNGSINLVDAQTAVLINNGQQSSSKNVSGKYEINSNDPKNFIKILNGNNLSVSIGVGGINTQLLCAENIVCSDQETEVSIALNGNEGTVSAKNVKVKDFNVPEILHGNVFITPSAANTPTRKGGNIREDI